MSDLTTKGLKRGILQLLSTERHAHKLNLIGRDFQRGSLEVHLNREFNPAVRARAAHAFEELRHDGYLVATYRDIVDPENWVAITDLGTEFLSRDLKDTVDFGLEAISPHLVELRQGMWDAVNRTSPDAPRQAANSARELLDQLLRLGAPADCPKRKDRFRFLMQRKRAEQAISKGDLEVIDASYALVEAEHKKILGSVHSRTSVRRDEMLASAAAVERILGLIFQAD
jgi:hypothetical protein